MAAIDLMMDPPPPKKKSCVVLGGRGFLGRSLVTKLLRLDDGHHWIVRVADSTPSLQLDPNSHDDSLLSNAISHGRASYHSLDLRNNSQLIKAFEGSSVVFYMDSSDIDTSDFYLCYMIIVQGTKNVINACRECKVRKLIYNSTADVVFDGSCDIRNGDESLTYSWKYEDMLIDLKAQAEALVLFASNIDGLLTCAIRPSSVFGPGDKQLVPFLINLAKSGLSKFIVGSGENMSDFTYSENVIHAHLCAVEALDSRMVIAAGKAFFITNLESVKFWDFASILLEGLGYQRPFIKIPGRIFGYIFMLIKWVQGRIGFRTSNYTLSAQYFLHLASRDRTFNCSAAKKYLGYSPVVSLEEGITRTVESFSQLAEDLLFSSYDGSNGESKVESLLGGGKVADILLWRDERTSFTYFITLSVLYCWFCFCGRTFTSAVAKLLLLATIVLYFHAILPSHMFGLPLPKISFLRFEVSDAAVKDSVSVVANIWNKFVCKISSFGEAGDWRTFLKVTLLIYLLKILSNSVTVLIAAALVFAFTAFFTYEQYELIIDGLARALLNASKESLGSLRGYLQAFLAKFLPRYKVLHKK